MGLRVVVLLALLLHELAILIELAEEIGGKLMVDLRCGAAIHIKRDAELTERVLDDLVVTVAHVLRRDALFLGTYGDGHAVLIGSTDENNVLLLQAEVSHIDV